MKTRVTTISRKDIKIRKGRGLMPSRPFKSRKTYTRKAGHARNPGEEQGV